MGSPLRDEKVRKILARNVKAFLAFQEVSENALATRCKLSQKQINNITNARTGCGIDALAEMARAFGCEPWVLLVDGAHKDPPVTARSSAALLALRSQRRARSAAVRLPLSVERCAALALLPYCDRLRSLLLSHLGRSDWVTGELTTTHVEGEG